MKNLILIFGFVLSASNASAYQSGAEIRKCIEGLSGCEVVKSFGTVRANTLKERCTPERDPFSCHLIDSAFDVILNEQCSLTKVRFFCAPVGHYPNTTRLHVGPRSCFLDTWNMVPGDKAGGWCECGKRKMPGFKCDQDLTATGLRYELIKHTVKKYGNAVKEKAEDYFGH